MMTPAQPARGRGRPPRVSRESIIDAARDIAPELLSMQSVATRLGVDRSTIHYHFADREELFSVVASAVFASEMSRYVAPDSDDWRAWVRSYSRAVHTALLEHSELAGYVRLNVGGDTSAFRPTEGLISKLLDAGFAEQDVAHAIAYISEVVHAVARNEIEMDRGKHPQAVELERFFESQPPDTVPGVRRLIELVSLSHGEHFEFAIDMIVAGMEVLSIAE